MVGGYLKLESWDDEKLAALLQKAQDQKCQVVFNVCPAAGSSARACYDARRNVINDNSGRQLTLNRWTPPMPRVTNNVVGGLKKLPEANRLP